MITAYLRALLIVCCGFSTVALGQESENESFVDCTSNKIRTIYVNGINNKETETLESMERLALEVKKELILVGDYDHSCFEFRYSYNRSQGFLNDIIESYEQAFTEKNWSGLMGFLSDGFNNLTDLPEFLSADLFDPISTKLANFTIGTDEAKFQIQETSSILSANIEIDLNRDTHVLLISHSQGNFYANKAYDELNERRSIDNYLSIVGVATPSNYVAGRPGEREAYTTNYSDFIRLVADNLPANVRATDCDGSQDLPSFKAMTCHNFVQSYMTQNESRENILRDYFEKVDAFINFSDLIGTVDRLTNFASPDVFIPEAVSTSDTAFLIGANYFGDNREAYIAKGSDTAPEQLDVFIGANDYARSLVTFDGVLFWLATDETGIQKLYRKSPTGTSIISYCFNYVSICDANVVRLEVVGSNLIAYTSGELGRYTAYVLRSGAAQFTPIEISDGSPLIKRVWAANLPGALQVGNYIYIATPEFSQPATIWRYELDFRNPVQMPSIVGGDQEVVDFVSFQGELYFLTRRQGNRLTYTMWAWDGGLFQGPRQVQYLGLTSGRLIATESTLYLLDRGFYLRKFDEAADNPILLGGYTRYKDLLPYGNTLYYTEGRRGTEGDGPMSIFKITDGSSLVEPLASYERAITTPRIFRGELYFFEDNLRKINSSGQIELIDIPDFISTTGKNIFPGDDQIMLLRARSELYGDELWGLH